MKVEYKKLLIRGAIVVIAMIIVQNYMLNIADISIGGDGGYYNYFNIQNSSREILYNIFLIAIIPSLIIMCYYDDYHHKHDNLCILRIGYKKYYLRALMQIFIFMFLLRLIVEVIFVLNVHCFYSSFDFSEPVITHFMFGDNALVNLVAYIFIGSIGTGVLGCFWFSIIYFIKNRYVYRGLLVLVNLLSVYAFLPVHSFALLFFKESEFLGSITSGVAQISLTSPGTMFESYGLVNFISSMIIYIIIIILLMTLAFRKKCNYG